MGSVAAVTNCGNMMWRLWIIVLVLCCECLVWGQDYYEPVWSGRGCREEESVDVGRGSGSCNSDCDCPLCAPYCSTSGYCQNHQRAGRRKCSQATTTTTTTTTGSASACPPLLGDPAPPGCNKTFYEDSYGHIPCQDYDDCPQSIAWWCDEWKPDIPDACDVLPADVTMSRCQENRCIFEADWRGVWVWCVDRNNNNILRIMDGTTNANNDREYSCRDDNDCRNTKYEKQGNFKCEYGRCIARNFDRYWRLIPVGENADQKEKRFENIRRRDCVGDSRYWAADIGLCGAHGGSDTITIGRSPASTSPISAQYTRRNSCRYCEETTCPPSRPCRRGGRCYAPTCNRRGRCWCKK